MTDESPAPNASIGRALLIAGLLIGVAVTLRLLAPTHLSPEIARRTMGVLLGVIVVVYANAVPKALSPLLQMRCDPAEEQAMRRFTGWSLSLGGLAYAITWIVAPLGSANTVSALFLAGALLLAVARFGWGMVRGPRQ